MKKVGLLLFICIYCLKGWSQEALHNYGHLKVHTDGAVGFHYDLINDGISDDNQGLVGFFSNESTIISGAFKPIFRDIEIMVADNLFLQVGVGVTNNTNFILGDVITPRSSPDITLDYISEAFYNGDDDLQKVNGYVSLKNKQNFNFPLGDEDRLRSLKINSLENIPSAKSAYFIENPDNPSTFANNFDTSIKADALTSVSTFEYWYLEADTPSWINLKWDEQSYLSEYITDISQLTVVGWHKEKGMWESLGGLKINGDLNSGQITSDTFLPNDYSIITFGSGIVSEEINLSNYLLTPNNDGDNDYLVLEAVSLSPNNELQIFNRWGRLVYSKENYDNTFDGKVNSGLVLSKNKILSSGVYFYVINLKDIEKIHQGYLYINQ